MKMLQSSWVLFNLESVSEGIVELLRDYRSTMSPDAMEKFIRVVQPHIHFFILGRVPESVDDIRAITLVEIAFNLININPGATETQIWSWCYTIARRQIAAHLKKQSADFLVFLKPEELQLLIDHSAAHPEFAGPDQKALLADATELLRAVDPECFELIWDRHFVGMSIEEMAFQKDLTYDAMRMKVSRCRDDAGELLSDS